MRPRPRLRNPLRSALPIRALLVALALALMLPTLSFAALLLWRVAENEESRVTANAQQAAERVMAAIDRELTASLAALQALATSPSLLTGDWAAFHAQADQAKPVRHGQIAVWNRAGQQLLNTGVPLGAASTRRGPRGPGDDVRDAAASGFGPGEQRRGGPAAHHRQRPRDAGQPGPVPSRR